MRDFPIFDTDYGISSLVLKEIPYKKHAFIHIRDVQPDGFDMHLKECVSFCRMAGAERIYASGHERLKDYPLYTSVLEMRGQAIVDPQKLECLFPVTEETVSRWRAIYNERMASVDNAATLEARDEPKILKSSGAYFIHRNGSLLGIGWMEDTSLLAVASCVKGAGERVMNTMLSLVEGAQITLEVASTNIKAIALYERLGFLCSKEVNKWYEII